MEEAAGVIAVEDEAVATGGVAAGIEHRTALVQLGTQARGESGVTLVTATQHHHIGGILEIGHQRRLRRGHHTSKDVVVLGTAGFGTVFHLVGNADVVHQGGYGVDLRRAAGSRETAGHLRPLVGGGAEVGGEVVVGVGAVRARARRAVGMAAIAGGGIAVVFHHLRGGGGHTAGHSLPTSAVVVGTEVVVVGTLVPGGGEHGTHGGEQRGLGHHTAGQGLPHRGHGGNTAPRGRGASRRVTLAPADLLLIAAQHIEHMRGDRLGLETVGGAVGQHGHSAVVATHQDESPLGGGEDVELGEGRLRGDILQRGDILHPLGAEVRLGNPAGNGFANGMRAGNSKGRNNNPKK